MVRKVASPDCHKTLGTLNFREATILLRSLEVQELPLEAAWPCGVRFTEHSGGDKHLFHDLPSVDLKLLRHFSVVISTKLLIAFAMEVPLLIDYSVLLRKWY